MSFDDPHSADFYVSSEPHLLDLRWTTDTLLETYWGARRTHEQITESIRNSLCFGLYQHEVKPGGALQRDRQVGFCRVVSDFATFSWLCDVVVDAAFRKRGLGAFMCNTVLHDPRIRNTVILLRTRTADGLYRKLGFTDTQAMWKIPG